uniref:Uncharacterized protein n=1 Tax=Megaviridae environmental sample TaxID=1737588 RepID=A0A5J6VKK6_9VIRU|nr:MAG: hypothetical protein [Megaviridae environmental sample]
MSVDFNRSFNRFADLRPLVGADEDDERGNLALHLMMEFLSLNPGSKISAAAKSGKMVGTGVSDGVDVNTIDYYNFPELRLENWGKCDAAVGSRGLCWKGLYYMMALTDGVLGGSEAKNSSDIKKILKVLAMPSGKGDKDFIARVNEPHNRFFYQRVRDFIADAYILARNGVDVTQKAEDWDDVDDVTYRTGGVLAELSRHFETVWTGNGDFHARATTGITRLKSSSSVPARWDAGTYDSVKIGNDVDDEIAKEWDYKVCKTIQRKLLEGITVSARGRGTQSSVLTATSQKYTRTANGDVVDSDGNVIDFQRLDPDCCKAIGTGGNTADRCTTLMQDCLSGNSIKECHNMMGDNDFWRKAISGARSIHPSMIKHTLTKFGVKFHRAGSVARTESIDDWQDRLRKEDPTVKISQHLIQWLNIVATIHNDNPEILSNLKVSRNFNTQWSKFGLQPKILSTNAVSDVAGTIKTIGILNQRPLIFGTLNQKNQSVQSGGSATAVDDIKKSLGSVGHLVPGETSETIRQLWENLRQKLAHLGKEIESADQNLLQGLMSNLENTEQKLHRSIHIADKYIDLLNLGATDDSGASNIDHFRDFVNKNVTERANKLDQQVNNLGSIFLMLAKSISQQGGSEIVPPFKYY